MDSYVYLREVLEQAPRLLGLLDKNPASGTYGCFDRQYWHYNTSDFPCARCQEAVLTLALLYGIKNELNPYYKNELILDYVNAGLRFWTEMQENNGSFNEWYPRENSFVATAFSSYAVSEALLQLEEKVEGRDEVIDALRRAGNWLLDKKEGTVLNQESGAAIALYNIYLLTDEPKYRKSSGDRIESIIGNQDEDGWFSEYGGADIGYLSLMIDYLAKYYNKTKSDDVLHTIKNSIEFISHFVHPNLTFGGEYGSRNTEYLIPHGFELMSKRISLAAAISGEIRRAIEKGTTISPSSLDDRYLSYIAYTYLQAYMDSADIKNTVKLPHSKEFKKNFPNAGLWLYSDSNLYLIVNYKKGGAFKAFFRHGGNLYDSGILVKTKKERLTSSWLIDDGGVEIFDNGIHASGMLMKVSDNILSPLKSMGLRGFQLTLGRSARIGLFVKNRLRGKLITKAKATDFRFSRDIHIREQGLEIHDSVEGPDGLEEVVVGGKAAYIYIPSSGYFQESNLKSTPVSLKADGSKKIRISRVYDNEGKIIRGDGIKSEPVNINNIDLSDP